MDKKISIILLILILSVVFISGCSAVTKVVDPCKGEFDECNYNCGQGLLSSICKEKCTYEYSRCKEITQ